MVNKKCMIILAILLSCCLLITPYPIAEASQVEGDGTVSDGADTVTVDAPSDTVNDDKIDTESLQYATIPDSALAEYQALRSTPENILSGPTDELLEYFLNSDYMLHQRYTDAIMSAPNLLQVQDYTTHTAFKELICREDFLTVLDNYAENLFSDSTSVEENAEIFKKVLSQSAVKDLLTNTTNATSNYPYLQSAYSGTQVDTQAVGDLDFTLNGINYYSAGTVSTANGNSVDVSTADSELTTDTVNYLNSIYSAYTRVYAPTAAYNCHSYAWYRFSTSNPYWIKSTSPFRNDSACTAISSLSSARVNDIIVYCNANGVIIHSGVITSIDSSGNVVVDSKWGQAGVYRHAYNNVPEEYRADATGILYTIYRYHDYEGAYNGNNYHLDGQHYLQYTNRCAVCQNVGETYWKTITCSGPPCRLPTPVSALEDELS